jgi:putative phage-type endonuclease
VRPFTIHEAEQGTPGWFAARAGKLTASRASDMMAQPRKGAKESVTKRNLLVQLAIERVTGRPIVESYKNDDMQRGTELEPVARALYEARTGVFVDVAGFLESTAVPGCGASLDGYIDDFQGVVEIKCPKPAIHLGYLRSDPGVPSDYTEQVRHQLMVTGAEWCDFVSFCPEFPAPLDLFIYRYRATDVEMKAYTLMCRMFIQEVEQEAEAIRAMQRRCEAVAS